MNNNQQNGNGLLSSLPEMGREFFGRLEAVKNSYELLWKQTQTRNEQLDFLTTHLLAVCFGEILERSEERYLEVNLPFKVYGIYVMHLSGLLASRGFVVFGKQDGGVEWIQANPPNIKRDDLISSIAVSVQENGEPNDETGKDENERVRELERKLLLAHEEVSRLKRQREEGGEEGREQSLFPVQGRKEGTFYPGPYATKKRK